MKKGFILSALIAVCCSAEMGAQTLKELVLKMPEEVCPMLSEYNKLEMVDNQKNAKKMQTRNAFQTVSEMVTLEDAYAKIQMTKSTEKELRLLKRNDSEAVIVMVSTVHVDGSADSSVEFYDGQWAKLDATSMMDEPVSDVFRHITLSKDEDSMHIVTFNPLAINNNDTFDKVKEEEKTEQDLIWNGERFCLR